MEDIARAAQVTKKTVFNHFPAKEDLVFDRAAERERELVAAVRDRAAGTSVLQAFRALCHQQAGDLPQLRRHVQSGQGFFALVGSSPSLQRRMTEHLEQAVAALAGQLRAEAQAGEDDPWPAVAAWALVGAQDILFRRLRGRYSAQPGRPSVRAGNRPRIRPPERWLRDLTPLEPRAASRDYRRAHRRTMTWCEPLPTEHRKSQPHARASMVDGLGEHDLAAGPGAIDRDDAPPEAP